jgi:hypothetical protein
MAASAPLPVSVRSASRQRLRVRRLYSLPPQLTSTLIIAWSLLWPVAAIVVSARQHHSSLRSLLTRTWPEITQKLCDFSALIN